jgi:hypothetical protein
MNGDFFQYCVRFPLSLTGEGRGEIPPSHGLPIERTNLSANWVCNRDQRVSKSVLWCPLSLGERDRVRGKVIGHDLQILSRKACSQNILKDEHPTMFRGTEFLNQSTV